MASSLTSPTLSAPPSLQDDAAATHIHTHTDDIQASSGQVAANKLAAAVISHEYFCCNCNCVVVINVVVIMSVKYFFISVENVKLIFLAFLLFLQLFVCVFYTFIAYIVATCRYVASCNQASRVLHIINTSAYMQQTMMRRQCHSNRGVVV